MSFSEWKKVILEDVADLTVGFVGSMADEYIESGIPFLRSLNIESFKIKYDGIKYISQTFHDKLKKSKLSPGDVVIVRTGKPGACTVIPDSLVEANCSDLVIIRPHNQKIYSYFLAAYINSAAIGHVDAHLVGAVQQHFNIGSAKKINILLPPLSEQKAIADTLSCLDDKIELNNRINKTLEEMAQAIFKSWFVDFEPFQDGEFEDNELGRIPKGWRVGSIYEICDVIYGAAFKSKLFNEDRIGFPLIRIRDLKTFSPQFYTDEKHSKAQLIHLGDILVGMDAEFRPCIWKGKVGVLNQRVCKFSPKYDYVNKYFIYSIIKPHMEFIENFKVGTTVSHIGKNDIDKIIIIIPTSDVLSNFRDIVEPLFERILNNSIENQNLTQIRDTLLPKLMSGEIRVPIEEV